MKKSPLVICLLSLQLVGCASIVTGSKQSLSVKTSPVTGASCQLSNDHGTWFIPQTPGTVVIERAYGDLAVNCHKDDYKGIATVKSKTKGMAFGNAIFGGLIGTAVDMKTGAAYDYPDLIVVRLDKDGNRLAQVDKKNNKKKA